MPHLGFAIVNPKVSMQFLKQAFEEKEYIKLNKVNYKKAAASTDKDWITFGVVASKSETKRSNAGNSFIIFG
ncbi:hypothetical protein EB796_018615 [Bugula neritina]|uniref:MCM10 OB-fold domain-containing protein n=1 Tax=Bugula neritina TaxID=10212 RepID=A0A7J7JAT0_BUGNE|nr:hypothetical protein EB796_018615 [Bugula neritina]